MFIYSEKGRELYAFENFVRKESFEEVVPAFLIFDSDQSVIFSHQVHQNNLQLFWTFTPVPENENPFNLLSLNFQLESAEKKLLLKVLSEGKVLAECEQQEEIR